MGLKAEMEAGKWLNSLPLTKQAFVTDALVNLYPKDPKPSELKAETERLMKDWEAKYGNETV